MKSFFVFLFAVVFATTSFTQDEKAVVQPDISAIKKIEDTLTTLAHVIINDSLEQNRFGACRKFIPTLVQALKQPNSFDYKFERLKSISIQYPQDSSFRIFTWQLYVDQGLYHYYGAIQMNTPDLKLVPLVDRSDKVTDLNNVQLDAANWFGSLYYNIRDFDTPEGKKYLLFGFDRYEFMNKRKIIDVLSFSKDGKPLFGAPVFVSEDLNAPPVRQRLSLDYAAEASIRCNYDEFEEMIIHDHLIELQGEQSIPGENVSMVPDGSFEGWKLENGIWKHVPKVFSTTVEEPPRPTPILDTRKGKSIISGQR